MSSHLVWIVGWYLQLLILYVILFDMFVNSDIYNMPSRRKWTSTIRDQESDRLTPVSIILSTSFLSLISSWNIIFNISQFPHLLSFLTKLDSWSPQHKLSGTWLFSGINQSAMLLPHNFNSLFNCFPEHCYLLQPKEFADISLRDIEQLAGSSFPLCMGHLFEKVK